MKDECGWAAVMGSVEVRMIEGLTADRLTATKVTVSFWHIAVTVYDEKMRKNGCVGKTYCTSGSIT